MPFELSFSDDFFWGEGEPYEVDPRPTNVMQAIQSMSDQEWDDMRKEVFDGREVDVHDVMDKIREVNTCSDLRPPVRVWVDEEGYTTLTIYEKDDEEEAEEEKDDVERDERGYPLPTVDEPAFEDLEHMLLYRGTCDATDGCIVEPDGKCEHGHVSWGRYLGFV